MHDIYDFREKKDEFFAHSPDSPLLPEQQDGFQGLTYYDFNPDLVIDTALDLFEEPVTITMQTNTSREVRYTRWGRFTFEVGGDEAELTVYAAAGAGGFFLPFKDATNGDETYGAGRYVDVVPLPGERYRIDFNMAYNPYCAYNDHWTCPIPPVENHLAVPIHAGEKLPEGLK